MNKDERKINRNYIEGRKKQGKNGLEKINKLKENKNSEKRERGNQQ